jgi:hypothetical protein
VPPKFIVVTALKKSPPVFAIYCQWPYFAENTYNGQRYNASEEYSRKWGLVTRVWLSELLLSLSHMLHLRTRSMLQTFFHFWPTCTSSHPHLTSYALRLKPYYKPSSIKKLNLILKDCFSISSMSNIPLKTDFVKENY